jgi:hypothetical protein
MVQARTRGFQTLFIIKCSYVGTMKINSKEINDSIEKSISLDNKSIAICSNLYIQAVLQPFYQYLGRKRGELYYFITQKTFSLERI